MELLVFPAAFFIALFCLLVRGRLDQEMSIAASPEMIAACIQAGVELKAREDAERELAEYLACEERC